MNIRGAFNLQIGGDFNRFDGHVVLQHGLMISGGDRPTADITFSVENNENLPVEESYRKALAAALNEFHGVILRSRQPNLLNGLVFQVEWATSNDCLRFLWKYSDTPKPPL